MKENVIGCFFSKHSVYTRYSLVYPSYKVLISVFMRLFAIYNHIL